MRIKDSGKERINMTITEFNTMTIDERQCITELDLCDNDLTDISVLAGLKGLKTLDLGYNNLTDISALAELKGLECLYLRDNKLTDVSALAGLTRLKRLFLWNTNLTDDAIATLKNALPNTIIFS